MNTLELEKAASMEPLGKLLKSLSGVLPFSFVIADMNQLVFSGQAEQDYAGFVDSLKQFSSDVVTANGFRHLSNGFPYAFYGVPISLHDVPAGALIAYTRREATSSGKQTGIEEIKDLLTSVADMVATWRSGQKESDEMAEQLAQSFEALSLYSRITPQITSFDFSEEVLRGLMVDLLEIMRADLIFTSLRERERYNIIEKRSNAESIVDPPAFVDALVRAIPPEASRLDEQYYIINNSKSTSEYEKVHPSPFRFLITPISRQHDSYGWLGLVSFNMGDIFRFVDLRMLTSVAKQIGSSLTNIDLYRELEQFVINVVRSLVYTIEAKDVYTHGHSERVSRHCLRIAERLQLGREEKRSLLWAAILHDMGKIGIPESVLNKPDKLTDEEYRLIKMHSRKGYNILKSLKPLSHSLPGILHHHERYDGKGYPEGLSADNIPFYARVIAVADTFDAITSDRSYRSQKQPEEALAIMNEVAGTQLDPELVQVFENLYRQDRGVEARGDFFEELQGVG
jgi:HD-GYP domain-containing protein (c-di-GMP phosphodiesterase class II)